MELIPKQLYEQYGSAQKRSDHSQLTISEEIQSWLWIFADTEEPVNAQKQLGVNAQASSKSSTNLTSNLYVAAYACPSRARGMKLCFLNELKRTAHIQGQQSRFKLPQDICHPAKNRGLRMDSRHPAAVRWTAHLPCPDLHSCWRTLPGHDHLLLLLAVACSFSQILLQAAPKGLWL